MSHSCKCHNKFIYNVWIVLLCRFLAWELGCQRIWNRLKFESELHLVLEEFWSPLPPPQWLIGTYSYSIYVGQYSGFIRVLYMITLAKIGNLKIYGFMELTFRYRDLVDFQSTVFPRIVWHMLLYLKPTNLSHWPELRDMSQCPRRDFPRF